mmetsp:Transcript_25437/g.60632  ORF Transcript_25437/g.60632 Transcript_25437/m.60632 type:complete len:297 (-) Transcript_25437:313-1203(-)
MIRGEALDLALKHRHVQNGCEIQKATSEHTVRLRRSMLFDGCYSRVVGEESGRLAGEDGDNEIRVLQMGPGASKHKLPAARPKESAILLVPFHCLRSSAPAQVTPLPRQCPSVPRHGEGEAFSFLLHLLVLWVGTAKLQRPILAEHVKVENLFQIDGAAVQRDIGDCFGFLLVRHLLSGELAQDPKLHVRIAICNLRELLLLHAKVFIECPARYSPHVHLHHMLLKLLVRECKRLALIHDDRIVRSKHLSLLQSEYGSEFCLQPHSIFVLLGIVTAQRHGPKQLQGFHRHILEASH